MNDNSAVHALTLFLRIASQDIAEQLTAVSFRSTFGVLLERSLRLAMGPVGYVLPITEAVSWLGQVGVRTYILMHATEYLGTTYSVSRDGKGNLLVEADRPERLERLPIILPPYLKIPFKDLFWLNPQSKHDRVLQRTAFVCGQCGRRILHGHGGHRPDCPLSAPRAIDPAAFVTRRTLPSPASKPAASDGEVSSHTCQECQQRIFRIDDFEFGHVAGCRVSGLSALTAGAPVPPSSARGNGANHSRTAPPRRGIAGERVAQCPVCERIVRTVGEMEVGHADGCTRRPMSWALGAGVPVTARPGPAQQDTRTLCRHCGHTVVNVRGHELGHGVNCPLNSAVRH